MSLNEIANQDVSKSNSEDQGNPIMETFRDNSFHWLAGIVSGLIFFLSVLVLFIWLWANANDIILGGPPPTLTGWEESYRELTGFDEVTDLDGSGVTVCVVDSGIEMNHPDLQRLTLSGWLDVINNQETPYDDEGHGTAMAGIIVAKDGLRGNAQGVDLLVAKAIDSNGEGTDEGIAEA
ncbi:MAG: S8 family serine peptidase, partial [Candidatus Thermoplasmatota archaeon]|nr:S8 family serine peptidase [Candidatus Thermoplasmatota archaeon]